MLLHTILNKQFLIIMKYRAMEFNLNNSTNSLRFLITSVIFFQDQSWQIFHSWKKTIYLSTKSYCAIITNMSISLSGIDLKYFEIAIT